MNINNVAIIGGGTISNVRPHLAITAKAYGNTPKKIQELLFNNHKIDSQLYLTKMAGGTVYETVEDIEELVDGLIENEDIKLIFMPVAICDYNGFIDGDYKRLETSEGEQTIKLVPTNKIIGKIRRKRKDIFVVGFKTTYGADYQTMFNKGLKLLKDSSVNLCLVNDIQSKQNMIVTPEESPYHVGLERSQILKELVDMTILRCNLRFTRSKVVDKPLVPWNSEEVNPVLREVVEHCINNNAYKPFNNKTVGHFAVKVKDGEYLTSVRKSNFNTHLFENGLVRILTKDDNNVIAHGAKPSVGGQSQRIIFDKYPHLDSIVHFHSPKKEDSKVNTVEQKYECGSHECGENTALGLRVYEHNIHAVMLDKHGPNIVFNSKEVTAKQVIEFIDENFNLGFSTSIYERVM